MLRLTDIRFRYDDTGFALRVPDFHVPKGEAVALVGPSGSGKTTLLHLAAGIRQPDRGNIRVEGVEVTSLAESERRAFRVGQIGLIFQEFELLEYLSIRDNVLLPYHVHKSMKLGPEVRDRAEALAHGLGIADKLDRLPQSLSQGERQRAAVCRALVTAPPLLLADEPTGSLDPSNKDRVMDALLRIVSESGTTVLAVTHDHDLLPRFGRVLDVETFFDRDGIEA